VLLHKKQQLQGHVDSMTKGIVCSFSIGKPYNGVKPDTRRTHNQKKKGKSKKK
jgi:hypothetical protein